MMSMTSSNLLLASSGASSSTVKFHPLGALPNGTASGTDGESRTLEETASCNQTNVDWSKDVSYLQLAGWKDMDLQDQTERSLEPLIETDGDETMMDHPGDSRVENPTKEATG